jgi:hypothetical protein
MTAPAQHETHANHTHQHGTNCGHMAVKHEGHTDYLHDGHMHHPHAGHVDEHVFAVDPAHPLGCSPKRDCEGHADGRTAHGRGCGHVAVPHGDHTDYLVNGHLHHPHNGHCDDHGAIEVDVQEMREDA